MCKIGIVFLNNIFEPNLPIIRLTKSKNKKTGTATFIFIQPKILEILPKFNSNLEEMFLVWKDKKISTNDIILLFNKGKPFLIKSVFLFKNSQEWFEFLVFMKFYCRKTGLSFTEIIN
jgi:photosystem II protein